MKKIFAIILSLGLLTLCACSAQNASESNEKSLDKSNNDTVSDAASEEISDITPENGSIDTSSQSEPASGVSEVKRLDEITVEHGVYRFYDNGRGEYFTEFITVENEENGKLTLNLKDGRSVELLYGEILYDENEGINKTEINGLEFWVEDITDAEGRMLQILECIERPERSLFIHYYPELDCGDLTIYFDYESNSDEYTFKYADGNTSVKTILYNEETEEYYFG